MGACNKKANLRDHSIKGGSVLTTKMSKRKEDLYDASTEILKKFEGNKTKLPYTKAVRKKRLARV